MVPRLDHHRDVEVQTDQEISLGLDPPSSRPEEVAALDGFSSRSSCDGCFRGSGCGG